MTAIQKFVAGLVAIGVITAATLPGRQTAPVLNGVKNLVSGSLHTAETGQF